MARVVGVVLSVHLAEEFWGGTTPQNSSARCTERTTPTTRATALSYARSSRFYTPTLWSTGAEGWKLQLLLGDVDLGERCTTRIGSSPALTQVQAGGRPPSPQQRAGSGPGGCNGRDPGGRRCKGYRLYQPGGRNRGGGDYYEGYSAADLNPYRPRYYS